MAERGNFFEGRSVSLGWDFGPWTATEDLVHNDDEMKRKGDEPATKRDLWAHAAATKSDLAAHQAATKADFTAHQAATKKDFEAFEASMKKDFAANQAATSMRTERLEKVVKNMAVEVVGVKSSLIEMREDFSGALKRMESRLIDRMDGFMAKTVKVERDEVWLIHRVDKLEDRVSRIEKRRPKMLDQ